MLRFSVEKFNDQRLIALLGDGCLNHCFQVSGVRCQATGRPKNSGGFDREKTQAWEFTKKRISNVEGMYSARREPQGRTIYSINGTERHAAQAPALRERNRPSEFCGSIFEIQRFSV